jgi:hypothetical protein
VTYPRRQPPVGQDDVTLLSTGVRAQVGTGHPVVVRKRDLTWLWCAVFGTIIGALMVLAFCVGQLRGGA